jgi:hypothetical protein
MDGEWWCRLKNQRFLNLKDFKEFTLYYNAIEKKKTGSTTNMFKELVYITNLLICILELQTPDIIALGAYAGPMGVWRWIGWPIFDSTSVGWPANSQYNNGNGDGMTCLGFRIDQPDSAATFLCAYPRRIICR